jgi:hypothetical protein
MVGTRRADVKFEFGSTTLELMLADGKNGEPLFRESRAELNANQQFTDAILENSRPAYQLVTVTQSNYGGGMGQLNYAVTDKTKQGKNIDQRVGSKTIRTGAIYVYSTITQDILNKAQENWKDASTPYNWAKDSASTVARSTSKYAGTYCALVTGGTTQESYYRFVFPKPTAFQAREITITAYVKTSGVGVGVRIIDSGGTTNCTTYHTGGGAYEQLTVTRTIDASATYVYFDIFCLVPSITDGGFEAWNDATTLTNYTVDAGSIAREAGTVNAGTYSCKMDTSTAAEIHQDATGWNNLLRGTSFTLALYGWANAANIRIGIEDGIGTTWSAYHGGTSAWAALTVTRVLDVAATRLRVIVQRTNTANVAYIDGALSLGRTAAPVFYVDSIAMAVTGGLAYTWYGTPIEFFENDGQLYLLTTKELCRWDETNKQWLIIAYAPTAAIGRDFTHGYSFNDYIFLATGYSNKWFYADATEIFTEHPSANAVGYRFRANAQTLWVQTAKNKVKSTDNPENSGPSFTTETTIGDSSATITDMWPFAGSMFFGKDDGLNYIDAADDLYPGPSFRTARNAYNFKGMRSWVSNSYDLLMCPLGVNGLSWYTVAGVMGDTSPAYRCPDMSAYHGRITSLAPDYGELYFTANPTGSDTKSMLMSYKVDSESWKLYPLNEINLNPVYASYISSLQATNRRLWMAGLNTASININYIVLSNTADPTDDTAYPFDIDSTSTQEMSENDFGKSGETKVFLYADIEVAGCAAARTIVAKYQIDGGTLTTLATIIANGMVRHYFPVNTTGKNIAMSYVPASNTSATTPELLKTVLAARIATEPFEIFTMTVLPDSGAVRHGSTPGTSTYLTTKATMDLIRSMATYHYVKMTHFLDDPTNGTVKYVSIIAPTPQRSWQSRQESRVDLVGLYAPTS